MSEIRIAILGASGYTGAELIRLLRAHPLARLVALTADRSAGKPIGSVFPQLAPFGLPDLVAIADVDWSGVDFVFCALPHGTTQSVIAGLPSHLKIVDLSADFRLFNLDTYAEWYGHPHQAPTLQIDAVYGLTEIHRAAVQKARLVANPGCFPTSALLPLVPLVEARQIDAQDVIIDAKTGTSGAGRSLKEGSLYCEVTEGVHAYGVAAHRHAPEIEQDLSRAAGQSVLVNFTPHLMPMSRGMASSIYVKLAPGVSAEDLKATLSARYRDEPFISLLPGKEVPQTRHVRGTNRCHINVIADRLPGRAIILSVIDNLVKGASGQAIQNMNAMHGLPETTGLDLVAVFP